MNCKLKPKQSPLSKQQQKNKIKKKLSVHTAQFLSALLDLNEIDEIFLQNHYLSKRINVHLEISSQCSPDA